MERLVDLNEHLLGNPAANFFFRVQDESMQGAGISSGYILIVDRSLELKDRQDVVALLEGEFTVKRLRQR